MKKQRVLKQMVECLPKSTSLPVVGLCCSILCVCACVCVCVCVYVCVVVVVVVVVLADRVKELYDP